MTDSYECACSANRKEINCAHLYDWDDEWSEMEGIKQGLYRKLCDSSKGLCIVTEFLLGVSYIQLSDAQITSSSVHMYNHEAYRVRIDNYLSWACCWGAAFGNPLKWVKFDLLDNYVVIGLLVRARCDPPYTIQRAKVVLIEHALDNSNWLIPTNGELELVRHGIVPDSYTHWFSHKISARYWKIYILDYQDHPVRKGDFIGKVDNSSHTC